MKCPACGNENQPGAKFCVHCGIVLGTASAPAWTAAPAGSASAPAPRPAAPVQPTPTPAPSVARPAAATGPAPAPAAAAAAAAPESTRKAGLMIAVIALL
ncbi:MAG: zinc ribbon domain-containing protein, partial [Betaproteobacteria bacterium]